MITDGNLISKGVNEGEAIALQPWQADPNIVNQALTAQRERQKEKRDEEKAQKKQMEDFQAQLLEDYKYNPLDAKAIKKFQDEAVEAIKNYRPGDDPLELKLKIQRLKIAKNDSYNTFVEGNKMMQQINKEKDSNYIEGLEGWTQSQVENDAADLDAFGANIAKREAARLGVYAGQKKIDNIDLAIAQNANTITKSAERAVQSKGTGGTIITKKEFDYDPEEVRRASDRYYDSHKKAMEEYNLDKNALYQLHEDKLKTMGGISIIKQTAPRSAKVEGWSPGGGAYVVGKTNFGQPYESTQKGTFAQAKAYDSWYKKSVEKIEADVNKSPDLTDRMKKEEIEKKKKELPTKEQFEKQTADITNLSGNFVPFTVEGGAENSPHQFNIVGSDGRQTQIQGTSNLYDATHKAFVVKTDQGTLLAPLSANESVAADWSATKDQPGSVELWEKGINERLGIKPTTKQEVAKGNAKNAAAQKKPTNQKFDANTEARILNVMAKNPGATREEVIKALRAAKKIQ